MGRATKGQKGLRLRCIVWWLLFMRPGYTCQGLLPLVATINKMGSTQNQLANVLGKYPEYDSPPTMCRVKGPSSTYRAEAWFARPLADGERRILGPDGRPIQHHAYAANLRRVMGGDERTGAGTVCGGPKGHDSPNLAAGLVRAWAAPPESTQRKWLKKLGWTDKPASLAEMEAYDDDAALAVMRDLDERLQGTGRAFTVSPRPRTWKGEAS